MRNPDRIDNILERLTKIWKDFPELRLGQLISNVFVSQNKLYYVEDEEFIKEIEQEYQSFIDMRESRKDQSI